MSLLAHAEAELEAAGYRADDLEDGPNKWMRANVLDLLRVFAGQGHSGHSAPYCIDLFEKLARYQPLTPLTGVDEEWNDVSEMSGKPMWQNKRCSRVFKGADGRAYDIDGKVFRDPDGGCFTNAESRVYVAFPYIPTTKIVDRLTPALPPEAPPNG